jgi:LacI family transcriptional regulator, fructose operon transcriptional repressor
MAKRPKVRKITIYDIARTAGTSSATVSLVLNGTWEKYRINVDTAAKVSRVAKEMGYRANLRARGLRTNRTGLVGMVIPHHRNRFFAGLVENCERAAHSRGLCPIVVSTQRDHETEIYVARALLAQQVDSMILAGSSQPDAVNRLCDESAIRCVNLDLPGQGAYSVVSDNRAGARALTERLVPFARSPADIHFMGGIEGEHATELRLTGFREALEAAGLGTATAEVSFCGYRPDTSRAALDALAARPEGMPRALFINSITALEGFATFLRDRLHLCRGCVVACFDWDPFAACLPLPIFMMRQDVEALTEACFDYLDQPEDWRGQSKVISPKLVVAAGDAKAVPVRRAAV